MCVKSDEVIQFYDEMAPQYDERVFHEKDYSAYQKIPMWLLEFLPSQRMKIGDLGCGTGLGSRPLLASHHQVIGVDISPQMLERARKLHFEKLICQNLEDPLPFSNEELDAAQMIGVMEFIQKPKNLFQEVSRIVKSKGVFGFTLPRKLPAEIEQELGIFTCHVEEIIPMLDDFEIVKEETFQGFIYKDTTIHYHGLIAKKK